MKHEIVNDDSVIMFAKMQVDGLGTGLEKHQWMKIIEGHAKDLYGDASPRSFTKAITESETGRLLYQALKRAPGFEVDPASSPDPDPQETPEERAASLGGPFHVQMHLKAVDHQKLTGKSYPQAYTAVYSHSDNRDLRQAVHNEHVTVALRRMGMV